MGKRTYRFSASIIVLSFLFTITSVTAQNLSISGGHAYSLAVCSEGKVLVWGNNTLENSMGIDQNGNPRPAGVYDTPQIMGGLPEISMADAGSGGHIVALSCEGCVITWGNNASGQLGNPALGVGGSSARPVDVAGVGGTGTLCGVKFVSSGNDETFAITNDNRLVSWGQNDHGQLGRGASVGQSTATPGYVLDKATGVPLEGVLMVEAGDQTVYALADPDGDGIATVYAWGEGGGGNNSTGQPGGDLNMASPVLKCDGTPLTNIKSITAGDTHGLAIDANGNVWSWGGNWGPGQRGNGNDQAKDCATLVYGGESGEKHLGDKDPIIAISAGQKHSMAVSASGKIYSWGDSDNGELGAGCFASSTTGKNTLPVLGRINANTPLTDVVSVSDGDFWTFAITGSGEIYVTGYNAHGESGIGGTDNQCYFTKLVLPDCAVNIPCPEPYLGPDREVCFSDFPLDIAVGQVGKGFEARWYKNGALRQTVNPSASQSLSFTADEPATYRVEIEDKRLPAERSCEPCPTGIDEVTFSIKTPPFSVDTIVFCGNVMNASIPGDTATFEWYGSRTGGTTLGTSSGGGFITVNTSEVTEITGTAPDRTGFIYVEKASVFKTVLGPETPPCPSTGETNSGNTQNGGDQGVWFKVVAYEDLTLKSLQAVLKMFNTGQTPVHVFIRNGGIEKPGDSLLYNQAINVNVTNTGNQTYTLDGIGFTFKGDPTGKEYWIKIAPQSGAVITYNCASFPYTVSEGTTTIAELSTDFYEYTNYKTTGLLMGFNWQIEVPSTYDCGRIPVPVREECTGCREANAGPDQEKCVDEMITLQGNAPIAGYTGTWTGIPAGAVISPNANTPGATLTNIPVGTHTLTWTLTNTDTCDKSDEVIITVHPLPMANAGPDRKICEGESTTLNASGGAIYQWSPATGLSCTDCAAPSASPIVTTTYTVTVTNSNGCSDIDEVVIEVKPGPCGAIINTMDYSICPGGCADIEISISNGTPPYSIVWEPNLPPATGPHNVCPSSTSVYYVSVTDDSGYVSVDSVTVTVIDPPTLTTTHTDISCHGGNCDGTATVTASGTGNFSYQWDNNTGNQATATATGLCPGTYSVTVTDGIGCVNAAATNIYEPTLLEFELAMDKGCRINEGEAYISRIAGGTPGYTYLWSHNNANTSRIIDLAPGTYCVTATDANGCNISSCIDVIAPDQCDFEVWFPNVITPGSINRDNDRALVRGKGIADLEIKIFNRWGELVYHTDDMDEAMSQGWNGVYKGRPAEVDTYGWYIKAKTFCCDDVEPVQMKGSITVLR